MIRIVSLLTHDPLVMVQIKLYTPPTVKPVTAEVGDDGLVILAALVVVHNPLPLEGVLPFKFVDPALAQIC